MILSYRGVVLDVFTNEVRREMVYEDTGLEPVMLKTTLSVTGYLNSAKVNYSQDPSPEQPLPATNAWGQPLPTPAASIPPTLAALLPNAGAGQVQPPAVPVAGTIPQSPTDVITTDRWVTKALMTPRGRLQFGDYPVSGGEPRLMIDQPPAGEVVDVGGGPLSVSCNVRSVIGSPSTLVVDFVIETFSRWDAYSASSVDSLIMSLEQTMTHSCDSEYSTIREVVGRCTFRHDAIEKLKLNPDFARSGLFLPVPEGYRRTAIQVTAQGDGRTLLFSWRDEQQHTSVVDYGVGIARIECEIEESLDRSQTFDEGYVSAWRSIYDLRTARNFAEQKKDDKQADPNLFFKAFPPAPNGKKP